MQLNAISQRILVRLRILGIANVMDTSSASIGSRYARADELGTPLGVTVNFDKLKDGFVTLRERDSMVQVRGQEEDVVMVVKALVAGSETWEQVAKRMKVFGPRGSE